MSKLVVKDTLGELSGAVADLIAEAACSEISTKGYFTIVLAGGTTPRGVYETLASPPLAEKVDWSKVHIFLGDERCVAEGDRESNFLMASEALLSKVPIPDHNLHPVIKGPAADEAGKTADLYERRIKNFFACKGFHEESIPVFDMIILGLGTDGHTLSLFPSSKGLDVTHRLVTENYVESLSAWRITMTYDVVNKGKRILFLACGRDKAEVMRALITGGEGACEYPACRIKPICGDLYYFTDSEGASLLDLKG